MLAVLFSQLALGADGGSRRSSRKLWWVSVAAVAAASFFDAHSSWGRPENNPLLRSGGGRFGGRGLGIKFSVLGAGCALEWLLIRKSPALAPAAAATNLGLSGILGSAAIRNYRRRSMAPPPAPPTAGTAPMPAAACAWGSPPCRE